MRRVRAKFAQNAPAAQICGSPPRESAGLGSLLGLDPGVLSLLGEVPGGRPGLTCY